MILVGNKCDMEDERVISFERGKQLADSLGLEFYETSAKENINVRVSISIDRSTIFMTDRENCRVSMSMRDSTRVW